MRDVCIPRRLDAVLNRVCRRLGLRKSEVVEAALREKIENLVDQFDLDGAIREAGVFHDWKGVKADLKRRV